MIGKMAKRRNRRACIVMNGCPLSGGVVWRKRTPPLSPEHDWDAIVAYPRLFYNPGIQT